MKALYACLFLSTIVYSSTINAAVVTTTKMNHANFSPVSWSFKEGEKTKIVYNTTDQVYFIQINIQTGGASITIDGPDSSCGNLHINENGMNTVICRFGSNDTMYIDNDNEYGLSSGTYQLEP